MTSMPILSFYSIPNVRHAVTWRTAMAMALLSVAVTLNGNLSAQDAPKIPVRSLGAITTVAKDSLGTQVVVRALSSGRVMVNDVQRRRVLLYDAGLAAYTSVIDSGSTTGSAMSAVIPSAQLIQHAGDSTLYVDLATQALLVFDNTGKMVRVMALPRPTDAVYLASGQFGQAWMDPKGRLIYRGLMPPKIVQPEPGSAVLMTIPQQSDSGPILRADFDLRRVDTITTLKVLAPGAMTVMRDGANVVLKMQLNPMQAGDEWCMLPDGSIAILRGHDYRIDFVSVDGKLTPAAKMPFDWKVLTDAQKQFKLDSMRPQLEKAMQGTPGEVMNTAEGPKRVRRDFEFVPVKELPDYEPPVSPGSLKVDPAGNLWIVPRTSASANGGVLYDVVNRRGVITERVQFPKGYALAGFGNGDEVYVLRVDGKAGFLERAKLR